MAKTSSRKGTNRKGIVEVKGASTTADSNQEVLAQQQPRSLSFASTGIATGRDFAGMMSALMSDVLEGRVPPQTANAVVNAGGKLLKVVEMQLKYGSEVVDGHSKQLNLVN